MSKRLQQNITSQYIAAADRMRGRKARRRIVAYVESYDDVFFWRGVLSSLEDGQRYFEVMLPSRQRLGRGKKAALMSALGAGLGENMIVCVDADYDYLMQRRTEASRVLLDNRYVFHTYAYAIENFQCYAASLHEVCVMATLNDHMIFDFEAFMQIFSQTIFPLFVWSIWCYRNGRQESFNLIDFFQTVDPGKVSLFHPEWALQKMKSKVNRKISWLQRRFPQAKGEYVPLREEMKRLGVAPDNCYMYMRGHDLFDYVVNPLVMSVCDELRREREREIQRQAVHRQQLQNELASYSHSAQSPTEMLKKHTFYRDAPQYRQIIADLRSVLGGGSGLQAADAGE